LKFKDSLAGRKRIFHLYPLDFDEYLMFGGYPAVVLATDDEEKKLSISIWYVLIIKIFGKS